MSSLLCIDKIRRKSPLLPTHYSTIQIVFMATLFREMLDDTNSEDDNFLHFDDEEVDMTLYQKIPEEYKR